MRFVPVKSPEQQAALSMHRTRDLLVKQRTQLINMIRGLLAEFGVDIPKGLERALLMARQIVDGKARMAHVESLRSAKRHYLTGNRSATEARNCQLAVPVGRTAL